MGKWLMMVGAGIVVVGALLHFAPSTLHWFGNLPGDIRIRGDHGRVFIPITSMALVSIVLSLLMNWFRR